MAISLGGSFNAKDNDSIAVSKLERRFLQQDSSRPRAEAVLATANRVTGVPSRNAGPRRSASPDDRQLASRVSA
jgi:hypothetical protein